MSAKLPITDEQLAALRLGAGACGPLNKSRIGQWVLIRATQRVRWPGYYLAEIAEASSASAKLTILGKFGDKTSMTVPDFYIELLANNGHFARDGKTCTVKKLKRRK